MEKYRRSIGRWRLLSFVLLLCVIALLVGIIIISFVKNRQLEDQKMPYCSGKEDINLAEPTVPSVFHDLTAVEVDGLMKYLHSQRSLNLVKPADARVNNSYVYLAEVYVPPKIKVLDYLDNNGVKPDREAIVTIFRGDKRPPIVEEYIVGPLPNPSNLKENPNHRQKIPFNLRPLTGPELGLEIVLLENAIHNTLYDLVLESFDGKFKDCGDKCLTMQAPAPYSPAVSGVPHGRKIWFTMLRLVDFFILHPLDFAVLINFNHDIQNIEVEAVWYNGQSFSSLEELATGYSDGSVTKTKVPFPPQNDNTFSKMTRRGPAFQNEFKRDPLQFEPDGKRYAIHHNHVEYMGWKFYYRMSSVSGPQVYDIRFRNERIAYEISLQEIVVLYAGFKPGQMFPDYFDSCTLIGPQDKGLVPGIDCPAHATFMDTSYVLESSKEPITFKNAFCLFEQNSGYPLRRHHSHSMGYGSFYEGMPNVVLTLRSVFTVVNYDYIFDFIFFQNGVVQVRAMSTGYILATFHTNQEAPFGAQVHDNINGNLHTHLFNFKVDIDIKGKTNRFATWDITPTSRPNDYSAIPNAHYHMINYTREVKETEQTGAYKFDFETPKYLLFYNEQEKNAYGNPKAYRILNKGMVKQLFAEGEGNEPAASWARYQLAVTQYKESERRSSSAYSYMDSSDPVVQFQHFIDDDEPIKDEDLVAWVTMGLHHIPHTEDLPVTPSPGMDLSFYLLPYNYFTEDPAMASKSSVRIELKDRSKPKDGVRVIRYGPEEEKQCVAHKNNYYDMLMKDPEVILDTGSASTAI
ncbi:putative amine oxidase [copper-containing] [Ylistrum balloti]|uniref:putative amine oxidase [copper-containing] n=1 Tax=Ylistrum balloti TaxID=509963 RepID=UPI002905DB15|nr:putative amine oxidase [copper-containing] [Ylistrum balloti]